MDISIYFVSYFFVQIFDNTINYNKEWKFYFSWDHPV